MPFAVVLKVAAMGAAAATGAAGLVWSATASGADHPAAAVWVDNPLQGASVEPGVVTVTSHASAKDGVTKLVLLVDGSQAAEDTSLERDGLLSLGSFAWQAAAGTHELVVRSGPTSSDVVTVYVAVRDGAPAPAPTKPPGVVPTVISSATPSATSSATPSATATASPLPVRTTAPPTKIPTPKPSPAPAYVGGSIHFSAASVSWPTGPNGSPTCGAAHTVLATVTVANATSVSIKVGDHAFAATRSGKTWTTTVDTSQIGGPHVATTLPVTVLAQGQGGSATNAAGSLTVTTCGKD